MTGREDENKMTRPDPLPQNLPVFHFIAGFLHQFFSRVGISVVLRTRAGLRISFPFFCVSEFPLVFRSD